MGLFSSERFPEIELLGSKVMNIFKGLAKHCQIAFHESCTDLHSSAVLKTKFAFPFSKIGYYSKYCTNLDKLLILLVTFKGISRGAFKNPYMIIFLHRWSDVY